MLDLSQGLYPLCAEGLGPNTLGSWVAHKRPRSWELGWLLCDIWISLDVCLCTASILSLCAISVDRYFAVTEPLNYSRRRRSKRLAACMILIVWLMAFTITCPPIFGW
ncbi:unnamed protein product [Bemisia tabaci]|uniref:G-protein coupled receptors family 1 profile domain-containing protein n=1 Tax=Bemisia tabaci TaxID=7038 RepID=A0A9P0AHJ7_BEMTA|nr:unnamed protein product [Bemisia tabaci]